MRWRTIALKRTVDHVAVKLEASIIEHKVDPTTGVATEVTDDLPKTANVVSENVLLCSSKMFTTGGLQLPDILLGHVDEEREIGRVTPEADLRQLVEDEPLCFELLLLRQTLAVLERFMETHRKLKDGLVGTREGIAL